MRDFEVVAGAGFLLSLAVAVATTAGAEGAAAPDFTSAAPELAVGEARLAAVGGAVGCFSCAVGACGCDESASAAAGGGAAEPLTSSVEMGGIEDGRAEVATASGAANRMSRPFCKPTNR